MSAALHAFADESTRGRYYIMCAATVRASEVSDIRAAMTQLRATRQRRIHFVTESDSRRKRILDCIAELGVASRIYVATEGQQVASREAILREMVPDLLELGVRRLVLDSRDGQDPRDRSIIARSSTHPREDFSYDHVPSAADPLLWTPDAIAWAWGRGGQWKQRVERLGLVEFVANVKVR